LHGEDVLSEKSFEFVNTIGRQIISSGLPAGGGKIIQNSYLSMKNRKAVKKKMSPPKPAQFTEITFDNLMYIINVAHYFGNGQILGISL
jgi:hypothetical protein